VEILEEVTERGKQMTLPALQDGGIVGLQGMDFMRVHTPDKQNNNGSKRPETPPPKGGFLSMYPQTESTDLPGLAVAE
jgi:hypothetical protein